MMTEEERLRSAQEEVMMLIHENPSLSSSEMVLFAYLRGYKDGCVEVISNVSCDIAILNAKTNGDKS